MLTQRASAYAREPRSAGLQRLWRGLGFPCDPAFGKGADVVQATELLCRPSYVRVSPAPLTSQVCDLSAQRQLRKDELCLFHSPELPAGQTSCKHVYSRTNVYSLEQIRGNIYRALSMHQASYPTQSFLQAEGNGGTESMTDRKWWLQNQTQQV